MVQDCGRNMVDCRDPEYTARMSGAQLPMLIAMLACPVCKQQGLQVAPGSEAQQNPPEWLVCRHCNLRYPIVDGIAVLLAERAK
ncbi:MAG TPA: Trm112 family protein [Acidobacteriaceae bacterium]|jgi:uncharacterized protein YbaR (Trm112 family)|nr:Trm112 family protein [Acidobacteriaceae bacterium]